MLLAFLFAVNTVNFFDRLIIGAVGESVRREFVLSDTQLGLLSTGFVLIYAVAGIPIGRLADRYPRKWIISAGVFLWSLMTAASGIAASFGQLLGARFGVGIGEASLAPAATSLIGDAFPASKRATAMSIFMLGLPIGIGLSFAVSGTMAQAYGWRTAFLIASIPGIPLALLALVMPEPRGSATNPATEKGTSSAFASIASIFRSRTMWWLIASGVLHNFCLYTLSSFMTPFMMRFHGLGIRDASMNAMLINGVFTLPGLLLGGVIADAVRRRNRSRGLWLTAVAVLLAAPLFGIAVSASNAAVATFVWAAGVAFALMYFYYSAVYAAIQDVVADGSRAMAMAVYFFFMYVLGGGLGPTVTGALSDHFTRRAASAAGIIDLAVPEMLEPFRAVGLQHAMYVVPVLCVALAAVMAAAALALRREVGPEDEV